MKLIEDFCKKKNKKIKKKHLISRNVFSTENIDVNISSGSK